MKTLHRFLYGNDQNIQRRTYIWNAFSSIAFSIQSAVFLLVATRVSGETGAGAFIILYTVAQTLSTLGNYNLRDFQVSDIHEEYSFGTYYTTRLITCALMLAAAIGYSVYKGLDRDAMVVLFSLVGYRFIECLEDVYHGMIHRLGRFDVSSLCMAMRIIITSVLFCLIYIVSGNQVLACLTMLGASVIYFCAEVLFFRSEYAFLRTHITGEKIRKLLIAGFPVFLGAFLYSYLINAPKYAIDDLLSKDMQTVFNVLFMPVFGINMISLYIYRPKVVQMSRLWDAGDIKAFRKTMFQQIIMVSGITVLVGIGGFLIGWKLLETIYNVSLTDYRVLFLILLLFGGITALSSYFVALLTVVRKQKYITVGYGAAFLIQLITTRRLVSGYGIHGAGYAYGIIVLTTFIVFFLVILKEIRNRGTGLSETTR